MLLFAMAGAVITFVVLLFGVILWCSWRTPTLGELLTKIQAKPLNPIDSALGLGLKNAEITIYYDFEDHDGTLSETIKIGVVGYIHRRHLVYLDRRLVFRSFTKGDLRVGTENQLRHQATQLYILVTNLLFGPQTE